MRSYPLPQPNTRLGFHYYPDSLHYRESDLQAWLPELRQMGASWVTLVAPAERAVPEFFLQGLLKAGIEPVLHFHLPLDASVSVETLVPLFEQYARWGVHYAALFDRPNARASWAPSAWAQSDLVERFLDLYLPLAEASRKAGLAPVFPPLEPGGDYWDTAFLRAALRAMRRRGHTALLDALVLGAYAWAGNHPLNWGAGGPERWPMARPYFSPPGVEDQRGFRIFDWYTALSDAELGRPLPILLLGAGCRPGDRNDPDRPGIDAPAHARRTLALARLVAGELVTEDDDPQAEPLDPLPAGVLACCFWRLAGGAPAGNAPGEAWFSADGYALPAVGVLRQWWAGRQAGGRIPNFQGANAPSAKFARLAHSRADLLPGEPHPGATARPIRHYVLLPSHKGDLSAGLLDVLLPFIEKYHPTVGFSAEEAALAERVTLIGGGLAFDAQAVETLRMAGCQVDRITVDGPGDPPALEDAGLTSALFPGARLNNSPLA